MTYRFLKKKQKNTETELLVKGLCLRHLSIAHGCQVVMAYDFLVLRMSLITGLYSYLCTQIGFTREMTPKSQDPVRRSH